MRLTDDQVTKYQQLFLETYGKPISKEDAMTQGIALLRLVKVLAQSETNHNYTEDENDKEVSATRH